ncbi:MAG: hypothetical protein WC644_03515 [Ignavibacteria bacterium]
MMKFSETTIDLILDIKEYSGGILKNEFELSALIEQTFSKHGDKSFHDIIFKAKFLKGLSKVMSVSIEQKENYDRLISEYSSELKNLTELILNGLNNSNPIIINSFKSKFFDLTPDCLLNLNLLIEDLSVCKDYFNDIKNNQ